MTVVFNSVKAALDRCLDWALENDDFRCVQAWLDAGAMSAPDQPLLNTCLQAAIDTDNLVCTEWLLQAGANPDAQTAWGEHFVNLAQSRPILVLLLQQRANMHLAHGQAQRLLLGLPTEADSRLLTCNEADFHQHRAPRYGEHNAENISSDFHRAMIESGIGAFSASEHFRFEQGVPDQPWQHIWNVHRFGQSITQLPDGRWLQIGGEHEDFYDPDFFIYNDVIVHTPPGASDDGWQREVYAYPRDIFPPTDFHSATLVGDNIIVIGNLGYPNERLPCHTPVYMLNTLSMQFSTLACTGNAPGWVHRHQAVLDRPGVLAISGGQVWTTGKRLQDQFGHWELNIAEHHWYRVD